jgi:hypothetical protein
MNFNTISEKDNGINGTIPFMVFGWSGKESTITEAVKWPIVPALDDDECGTIGGNLSWRNQSTGRKPAQVPLFQPQIPHDLIRARTWAAVV